MPRQKTDSFDRKVSFRDENFVEQESRATGKVPVAATYEEAVKLFGNDSEKILNALNQVLREDAIAAAMKAARRSCRRKQRCLFRWR